MAYLDRLAAASSLACRCRLSTLKVGNGLPNFLACRLTDFMFRPRAAAARATDAPVLTNRINRWHSSSVQSAMQKTLAVSADKPSPKASLPGKKPASLEKFRNASSSISFVTAMAKFDE
jgi:hypothetical protein